MEPVERASATKQKSKKTSRRSQKRRGTSSSVSSRLSTADEESSQAKSATAGIHDADAAFPSTCAVSDQLPPVPVMTPATKERIPDTDGVVPSSPAVYSRLPTAPDVTPAVKARSSDADAAVPSTSAASVQLSLAPDMTPAKNPPVTTPVVYTGALQPTAYVSDENSMLVEEPVVVASPLSPELPHAREDVKTPSNKDLDKQQRRPGQELMESACAVPPSALKTVAAGEEQMTGRLIRPRLSDVTLPESEVVRTVRNARKPSAVRRFRDMGRSIRSSISSSVALSPTAWAGSGLFIRRYSERAHEQQRLRALNAEERSRRPPHGQEALYRKAALSVTLRILIGVLLMAALVVGLRMLIPALPMPDVCRSHSCMEYSERLRRSLNLSVNPCDSLEGFVCSGWNAHNILSQRLNLLDTALARLSRLARSGSRVASGPQNPEQRGAALFRSCDAVLRGERNEALSVMDALDEAHVSWPGRSSTRRQPDALRTLLFTAIRLGWAAILRVDILA